MADVEFSHGMGAYGRAPQRHNPREDAGSSLVTMTNMAGAVVSLVLIAGVGIWGYKLMVRDVSGIPVVRAASGEMRVRPENPGGQLARHQGLAVNAVAAEGVAAGPVEQVVLAPRTIQLAEEDQPIVAPVVQPAPLAPAGAPDVAKAPTAPEAEETAARLQQGAIDEVVAQLAAETAPMVGLSGAKSVQPTRRADPAPAVEEAVTEPPKPEVSPAVLNAPGVRVSMRPRLRPQDISTLIQPASFAVPAPTREIDPDAIPSGTRLAQLGAFDSAEVARAEWTRLEARFGDYLQDKSRVVQKAQSNGRTFYRLRAMGFVDLNDTRRFCSAFKAESVDCIPVLIK